jgi:orotidine-5'-phosphate decarboxylase
MRDVYAGAAERGKGVFVLCATSNPEGAALQQATMADGNPVAANVWCSLGELNAVTQAPGEKLGSFGAVIGATLRLGKFGLGDVTSQPLKPLSNTPILAPGFGAQGARLGDLDRLFGEAAGSVIASVSRSVLSAGPSDLDESIQKHVQELASAHD